MPLVKSSSKAARQINVRRLIDEGYPPRQAVAIAYSTQRRNRSGYTPASEIQRTKGGVYVVESATMPEEGVMIYATFPTRARAVHSAARRDGFGGFVWHDLRTDRWHVVEGDLWNVPINRAGGSRRNRAGMSDEDFKQRYQITTVRGVIYGYKDMLRAALANAKKSMYPVRVGPADPFAKHVSVKSLPDLRERVVALLNDDDFMRFRRGTIPARVADDIANEISHRSFQ